MPSKTSKKPKSPPSLWKEEGGCSELRVLEIAAELARELRSGDAVLLEGEMGAGKSTFARAVIQALGVVQPAEGSPTFAIAHEYVCGPKSAVDADRVVHVDFYRLKNESEVDDAGLPAYFWDPRAVVLSEWTSRFEAFESSLLKRGFKATLWRVDLGLETESTRRIQICGSVPVKSSK